MLLVIILFGSLVFLGDSQSSKSKVLACVPPTLLDNTESSDSSCPSQSIMDEINEERRKARKILNNNYRLRPCNCGGPGGTRVLFLDKTVWTHLPI